MSDNKYVQWAQLIAQLSEDGDHVTMTKNIDWFNTSIGDTHSVWNYLRTHFLGSGLLGYSKVVVYYFIQKEMNLADHTHKIFLKIKGKTLGHLVVSAKNGRIARTMVANACTSLEYGAGVRTQVVKKK